MTSAAYDVLGIGNAIVDVLSRADDAFLSKHGLVKGSMMLIDEQRAETLYAAMGPGVEVSGGSCGNTMAGVASFGGKGAYIGKVRDDQLGQVFGHDLKSIGVSFDTQSATAGPVDGALPDPGDARRAAHHEHLSRRLHRARPQRHRHQGRGIGAGDLRRGLSVGRARGQEGGAESLRCRACGGPAGLDHAVGLLLRAPLSRGVPRSRAQQGRYPVRQRSRDQIALRGRDLRGGAGGHAQGSQDRRPHPQREGLGRDQGQRDLRRAGGTRRARSSTRPAPAISTPRASCSASHRASRSPSARGWAASPRPRSSPMSARGPSRRCAV